MITSLRRIILHREKLERGPWWTWWPLLRRSLGYARPYWHHIAFSLLLILLSSLFSLLAPWPLAILVDTVLGSKPLPSILPDAIGSLDTTKLLIFAAVGGLVLTIVDNVVTVVNEYVTTRLDQWMVLDLRSELFRHSQRLSLSFYDEKQTGTLMYQINSLAGAVGAVIVALPPILQSIVTLSGMFFIAYVLDPTLALLSLCVVPFIYGSIGYYARRIEPRLVNVRGLEGQSLSIVHEAISMLRVIVAFGRERYEYLRFREQGEKAVRARIGVTVRQTVFSLVVNTTTAAGTALVLGFGAWHVLRGSLSVGELLVLMGYIAAIYKPLEQLSGTVASLQEQFVGLRSVFALLAVEPEVKDAEDAVDLDRVAGRVTFESVHFDYKTRKGTLVDLTFAVEPGQRIAVVGPTGAGKTTLISLLARFYDPSSGRILLDGVELKSIRLEALRRQISVVLQEPLLFSGTIAENIRYGRLDATDHELVEAARAANIDHFVRSLPDGYGTKLGERGTRLSGGERQRISVARAFLKDAPILILDEPTSSIDSRTEATILDALDTLSAGRTTFTIAHRLSTVLDADLVLVLNDGALVERGTHTELLAQDGLYRQLWVAQTGARAGADSGRAVEDARLAAAALVRAVRHLLAAGPADLADFAASGSTSAEISDAASLLAALTPEQLDALRDLDDGKIAPLVAAAVRPAEVAA